MAHRDKEDTHGKIMLAKNLKQIEKHPANKVVTAEKNWVALTLGSWETISWNYALCSPNRQ